MASQTITFETGHEEMIHDAQMDYYGKRLATASSDRTIKIFDVVDDRYVPVADLKNGHDGPVWQISWAHPKFGSLIASCGYDCRICIWREDQKNVWGKVFEDASHTASVNAIAWAPHSYGLCLAAGSADGTVSVLTYKDKVGWERKPFTAHKGGVSSVSWGPDVKTGSLVSGQAQQPASLASGSAAAASSQATAQFQQAQQAQALRVARRLVTGGCDNRVRMWRFSETDGEWSEQKVWNNNDNAHTDWVRDVAWAPSLGLAHNTIASASEDRTVIIWTEDTAGLWKKHKVLQFKSKVWRVSWSILGNILAVSQGDNKVSLWKESLDGDWKNLSDIKEGDKDDKVKESKSGI